MYAKRPLNLVDAELRRRSQFIVKLNLLLWPLGLIALAIWVLSAWPR